MRHEHSARFLGMAAILILALTGASRPLNPLVMRKDIVPAEVTSECGEGLAPSPSPRLQIAANGDREIALASMAPPPSRELRDALGDAYAALVRNDRPAFDALMAEARNRIRSHPAGGERTAAEETFRALHNAGFVWTAQFQSPFFDESSEAYSRVSAYPGYGEAVRRGMLTDDSGRRFYPATESREFLTRVAADELGRLGVRPTTSVARGERRAAPAPEPLRVAAEPPQRRTRATSASKDSTMTPAPRTSSVAPSSPKSQSRKSVLPSRSLPASPDRPALAKAATESAPAAPPAAEPTPAAPASPEAEGQRVDEVPVTSPAGDVASTAPAPSTPAPATTERRSVVVPALLILVGLGVLIVLFRVSK